jgi:hypothetical protein
MRDMAMEFYEQLYTSEGAADMEKVLDHFHSFVTEDMNQKLTTAYSKKEIETALFQMDPTKSPGPDGLPALFYQRHWAIFKDAICNAV